MRAFPSGSREIAVNFPTMQAAHEGCRTLLEDKADAIITEPDVKLFTLCLKTLEVGNFLKGSQVTQPHFFVAEKRGKD